MYIQHVNICQMCIRAALMTIFNSKLQLVIPFRDRTIWKMQRQGMKFAGLIQHPFRFCLPKNMINK